MEEIEIDDLVETIQSYKNDLPELIREFFIYNEDYIVSLLTTQLQTGTGDVQLEGSLDYAEVTAKRKTKYPKNIIDNITSFITLYSTGEMQDNLQIEVVANGDNDVEADFISNVDYFENIRARTGDSAFTPNPDNEEKIDLLLNDYLIDKFNEYISGN